MNKKEVLSNLRLAKSAHIQWRAHAQAIVAGIPVEQDTVPVIHTSCKFGRWYYGKGQQLDSLSSYGAIEGPHEMLHQVYMKIYKLYFGAEDRSMLKKLFGSSDKARRKRQEEADRLLHSLLGISNTLLEAITQLENEIKEMPESEFSSIY